jgi:hypothetical protein
MYYSRKTTAAESKLHSFELETLAIVYSLKRFRNYLFGVHFLIVTDCIAVKYTLEKKDLNAKIARWSLFLEEFNFDIQHRKGERMQHVDALSRVEIYALNVQNQSSLFDNSLYINQLRDTNVQKLKEKVETNHCKDYEIRDGILYRKDRGRLLIYVPDGMIDSVLTDFMIILVILG